MVAVWLAVQLRACDLLIRPSPSYSSIILRAITSALYRSWTAC